MSYINRRNVTHGAIYLYIENVLALIFGYLFWIVVARLTTPDVIGTAAAVISLSTIITTTINLGIPISVEKFLGKAFIKQMYGEARLYISASILLLVVIVILTSLFFFIFGRAIMTVSGVEFSVPLLLATFALVISSAFGRLFRGIIIASLKTRVLITAAIASIVAKFAISIFLVFLGHDAVGLTIGITSFYVSECIILGVAVLVLINRRRSEKVDETVLRKIKDVLAGGMPAWVPALVTSFGTQLGTLLVFGWQGSAEAGFYYIAFSIYTALAAVISVIFSISFPVLSAMDKGHSSFSWKVVKFSLILSLPFSFAFAFYPGQILSLFGPEYANAASSLVVLIMSLLPITIMGGITNLLYSQGHYNRALIIGIAASMPRPVFYFALVPIYGGLGAAIAFTIGSIIGLAVALVLSKNTNMRILWKQICLISFIPILVPLIYSLLPVSHFLGIPLSILTVYLIYFRLNLPTKSELSESLSVMPRQVEAPIRKVYDILNPGKS